MGTWVGAGTGLSLGLALGVAGTAQAEDLKVTNLNADGPGSLRDAIDAAESDSDSDRILFKSKLSGEIELDGSVPVIANGDLEIVGPGARKVTVNAPPVSSVFLAYTYFVSSLDLSISGLTLSGGDSNGRGGAILAYSNFGPTDLTLSNLSVRGNSAGGDGGGVSIENTLGTTGSLTIESSTISGNSSQDEGGGIYSLGVDVRMSNSTISGNDADDFGGGAAVFGSVSNTSPSFDVRNSTVTRNQANAGGGLAAADGASGFDIVGSIVAGNTATIDQPDLEFGPWNAAFSLIGDTGGVTIDDQGGSIFGVNPKLKPLANNGGPTDTHAFKKSPVKNKLPKGQTPKDDQRGAPRKGKGDFGAYELVKCEGVIVNRVGTAKKDKLKGTKKADGILGLGGNDKLSGKKGRDGLCGGKGKDKLKGGPGKDKLDGGPGKDKERQ